MIVLCGLYIYIIYGLLWNIALYQTRVLIFIYIMEEMKSNDALCRAPTKLNING